MGEDQGLGRLSRHQLDAFHAGDAALFRRLVEAHTPRLLALARAFSREPEEAADLVQETWRRAYEKRSTYTGAGSILGWLYAVCRSVCLGEARRRSAREGRAPPGADWLAGSAADPEATAVAAAVRRSFYLALLELPDRQRDVVLLRLVDGLSTRETAEALGCADGTVKAALHHAVRKLRKSMEAWAR